MTTLEDILANGAKTARVTFARKGEVAPMWIGHTAADELVAVLPERFANTDDKDEVIAHVRRVFRQHGVVAYCFMTEAWRVDSKHTTPEGMRRAENLPRDGSLEFHPDRREVIQVIAENATDIRMGHYFILRPEHGKPTLSPFVKLPGAANLTGRIFHLLGDQ